MTEKRRWWLSWYEPADEGDFRPTTWPLPEAFLGYWCSGWREDDATLVAWIEASTEDEAKAAVARVFPGAADGPEWRFCGTRDRDWRPGDRFPLTEWMRERVTP